MMRVQNATGLIPFSLLQLYAVILAIALAATVPSQILNGLLTPNSTVPYNLTYGAISPSNVLPEDPSYETALGSTVKFYDYGVTISSPDTARCLARLRFLCMLHFPAFSEPVRTPQKITVGTVELQIYPSAQLTWGTLLITEHLLENWLEQYEYRAFKFAQWLEDLALVATGNLSRVGGE